MRSILRDAVVINRYIADQNAQIARQTGIVQQMKNNGIDFTAEAAALDRLRAALSALQARAALLEGNGSCIA